MDQQASKKHCQGGISILDMPIDCLDEVTSFFEDPCDFNALARTNIIFDVEMIKEEFLTIFQDETKSEYCGDGLPFVKRASVWSFSERLYILKKFKYLKACTISCIRRGEVGVAAASRFVYTYTWANPFFLNALKFYTTLGIEPKRRVPKLHPPTETAGLQDPQQETTSSIVSPDVFMGEWISAFKDTVAECPHLIRMAIRTQPMKFPLVWVADASLLVHSTRFLMPLIASGALQKTRRLSLTVLYDHSVVMSSLCELPCLRELQIRRDYVCKMDIPAEYLGRYPEYKSREFVDWTILLPLIPQLNVFSVVGRKMILGVSDSILKLEQAMLDNTTLKVQLCLCQRTQDFRDLRVEKGDESDVVFRCRTCKCCSMCGIDVSVKLLSSRKCNRCRINDNKFLPFDVVCPDCSIVKCLSGKGCTRMNEISRCVNCTYKGLCVVCKEFKNDCCVNPCKVCLKDVCCGCASDCLCCKECSTVCENLLCTTNTAAAVVPKLKCYGCGKQADRLCSACQSRLDMEKYVQVEACEVCKRTFCEFCAFSHDSQTCKERLGQSISQCIAKNVCTRVATGSRYHPQKFFRCNTCNMTSSQCVGVCESCVARCHKGHDTFEASGSPLQCFCDCGIANNTVCTAQSSQ